MVLGAPIAFPAYGRPRRMRRSLAWLAFLFAFFASALASAADFKPPPLRGHVVDEAGVLSEAEIKKLDRKLDRTRKQSGFAIVVYLLPKLPDGLTLEDVGYAAGNAWGVGSKSGDDGVLLLAALADRKVRIETGKGAGGALTDVQSSHINREIVAPLLDQGHVYEAMDRGVDAITKELLENTPGGTSEPGRDPSATKKNGKRAPPGAATPPPRTTTDYLKLGAIAIVIVGIIGLAIISPGFREVLFWILLFGRFGGGGGGGGGRRDDDDDGGSGYGGGGGSFGGGGSTDDY